MADLNGFDASNVEPNQGFDAMPKGDYVVIATASEYKDTKDPTNKNQYLNFDWEVVEGDYKGRRLWSRLNLINDNDTAVKIASGDLSAICRAVGILKPKDSSELHGKPLVVSIVVEKYNNNDKNEIKTYKSVSEKSTEPAETATATSNGGAKPPWMKG